jgi:hypothetical protein
VLNHRHVQLSRSLSHRRITVTSAQPLGSRSLVLSHRHVQLNRSLSHCVSHENHLEYHIISTLCTEDTSTSLHLRLRENDTPNSLVSSPHRGTQHSIYVSEKNHTPSSWASSPHKGTQHSISVLEMNHTPNSWASSPNTWEQRSISVLERNHTPISWAHPTNGLYFRSNHSICVLEDVSRSCNHQHFSYVSFSYDFNVLWLFTFPWWDCPR